MHRYESPNENAFARAGDKSWLDINKYYAFRRPLRQNLFPSACTVNNGKAGVIIWNFKQVSPFYASIALG